MIEYSGVQFEAAPGGGMTIRIRHQPTDNSEIIRVVNLSRDEFEAIVTEANPTVASEISVEEPLAEPTGETQPSTSLTATASEIIGN